MAARKKRETGEPDKSPLFQVVPTVTHFLMAHLAVHSSVDGSRASVIQSPPKHEILGDIFNLNCNTAETSRSHQ